MDWSAAGAPFVATRDVHFAATAIAVGIVLFRTVIATPVLLAEPSVAAMFRTQAQRVSWFGLAVAVVSGAIWLLFESVSMSGLPPDEALTADVLSTVVNETQFGNVMIIRAGLAICVAACLAYDRATTAQWLGLVASLAFVASIAWTGHAGATAGAAGLLHVVADALHLLAAATWLGGLVALILLLAVAYRSKAISLARDVVERFSIMGMVSVITLLLTGFINAAILVGSVHALVVTEYGRLLLLKLVLFALMLILALINRLLLTPRLAPSGHEALRWLTRNSTVELALGLAVLAVVGMLGTLHPAIHLVN